MNESKAISPWTWKHLKEALCSVLPLLPVVLLFQDFVTGYRWPDILLFRIGFRLLALGVIVWWFVRNVWRSPTRWSMTACLIGGAMLIFGSWGAVRLVLQVVSPLGSEREFFGLDVSCWWIVLLLGCFHVVLLVGGMFLSVYAGKGINKAKSR